MTEQDNFWRLVVNGVLVGVGLIAVSIIIFLQFPVGRDFVRDLRIAVTGVSDPAGTGISASVARPVAKTPGTSMTDIPDPLPTTVTIRDPVTVQMGISKILFREGETLLVLGGEPGFFVCDYLGDSVRIPFASVENPDAF